MSETKLIDMEEVYEITGGSEELFHQMMELFIEISPTQLSRISDSWDKSDYSALTAAAHDMKSSASSFGAKFLYESALNLEQSAKMKLELKEILPMIKDVKEKTRDTIEYYRNSHWPSDGTETL